MAVGGPPAEAPARRREFEAKLAFFQLGDPDQGHEFPSFSDLATLEISGATPRQGIVRILANIETCRYRVLMRDATGDAVLLNHFLLPGISLTVAGSDVQYQAADDYTDSSRSRTVSVKLTFESEIVRQYFQSKLELGLRRNTELIQTGPRGLTPARRSSSMFVFREDAPVNGIIAHLTRQCGGNVHDFGVVEVRASQPLSGRDAHIADLDQRHDYCSYAGPDQWIGYDFRGMRVTPTHYTLRSRFGAWSGQMNRWVIEGSLDGDHWVELAQGHEPDGFVQPGVVRSYPVERGDESRYIRIRELPGGGSNIILSGFELFGTLFDE